MRQELSPAIEDFLSFTKSQDYAKGTTRLRGMVLGRFLAINGNIWVHQITDVHVTRHFEVAARTRQASSLGNDHAALSKFFEWCRHTKRMGVDNDPMFGRRRAKAVDRERTRIPVTDFPAFLDAAEVADPRNRAVVALLLYTLARDSEVRDLRIRDLSLSAGEIRVRIHKTKAEDVMPVSLELDQEMRKWLTHYTTVVGPLEPHYYLVPARASQAIRDNGRIVGQATAGYKPERPMGVAARIVTPLLGQFGFPVEDADGKSLFEGAHTLRRSGARALFDTLSEQGYDRSLRIVQSMLHHKNQAMTEHYIGVTADRRSRDQLIRGHRMYPTVGEIVHLDARRPLES